MEYLLKSGILYAQDQTKPLARIKSCFYSPEKQILSWDNTLLCRAQVQHRKGAPEGNAPHCKEYILEDAQGAPLAVARPQYAQDAETQPDGWSLCHMPRVDHATVTVQGSAYRLVMHNSQNYSLLDSNGSVAVQVLHRGVAGGWDIQDRSQQSPCFLCGLFAFCRYMERENEFPVV